MAELTARASESGHWYTREGDPMYTVEAAKGGMRATTLRDARKLNLVPSVTTVLNVAAKPALLQWMQKQVLLAALTLPKIDSETEEQYLDRIINDSKEQGRLAADAGTDIHAAVQAFYEGTVYRDHEEHVKGCVKAISGHYGDRGWICERSFAHDAGFGGKVDMHVPASEGFEGIVVDIKTKEFTDPADVKGFDDHLMQLAAYRVGLGIQNAQCANVFVSRSRPGLSVLVEWSQEDLRRGWQMFYHLLQFWQIKNEHK